MLITATGTIKRGLNFFGKILVANGFVPLLRTGNLANQKEDFKLRKTS
jgi:hypothetical protein